MTLLQILYLTRRKKDPLGFQISQRRLDPFQVLLIAEYAKIGVPCKLRCAV
jgi:hypothetical protein